MSLVFVVISINRNSAEATADSTQRFYDSVLAVEMMVAADAAWSEIIVTGRKPESRLSEVKQYRYDAYLVAMIDNWDGMQARFEDGLMVERNLMDWDTYFNLWAKRHVSLATWDRIKWQYTDPIFSKIERAIADTQKAQD